MTDRPERCDARGLGSKVRRKALSGAGARTRTADLLITNQLGPEIRGDRVSSDVRIYWEFVHPRDLANPTVFSCPSTIRPSTCPASSASAVIAENVHPGHVEMPRSLQHVAIIGVDLFKAMLLGAGQV